MERLQEAGACGWKGRRVQAVKRAMEAAVWMAAAPARVEAADLAAETRGAEVEVLDLAAETREAEVEVLDPAAETREVEVELLDPAAETRGAEVQVPDPAADMAAVKAPEAAAANPAAEDPEEAAGGDNGAPEIIRFRLLPPVFFRGSAPGQKLKGQATVDSR